MASRQCATCGTPETRIVFKGRVEVNLDPISGLCVDCLRQRAADERAQRLAVDYKAKQANDG